MAPPKKSKRGKNIKTSTCDTTSAELKFLSLEDVTCKICLDFMIKPVSLPCQHNLCFLCFENCVQKSNLCCPLCRKRISVWCRQAAKNNTVVNIDLWERIKAQFPDKVKTKFEGASEVEDSEEYFPIVPMHQFAEPGEILKEFEAEQHKLSKQEEDRRKEEERASVDLIAQLQQQQEEDVNRAAEIERIRLEDEALAKSLAKERESRVLRPTSAVQTPPSSRKRPRKLSDSTTPAAKRTITTFFSSRPSSDEIATVCSAFASVSQCSPISNEATSQFHLRSCSGTSSGSIDKELPKRLHFRPINAAPLTPPKHAPNTGKLSPLCRIGCADLNALHL